MQELIEEKFPFLDDAGVARVYKNVIDLVNYQSVRTFLMEKILHRKHLLSSLMSSQRQKVVLYHHIISLPEKRFVMIKNMMTFERL